MLIDKLKSWEYYYKKLPLYVRNSYGVQEHFKLIFDIMIQLDNVEQEVCDVFNILQENYLTKMSEKYNFSLNDYDFQFLDMIASIYGVGRSLNVSYIDNYTHETVNKSLILTNKELYMLIKSRIVQNNYDGTFEQSREYYNNIGLPLYMFTGTNPAECYLYLGENENVTENIRSLFLADLLTLKSVGITYIRYEINITYMGIWADSNEIANNNNQWDVSVWL